jgi:hypothetical protein
VTSGSITLAAALNAALGLHLADAAEARAWLADGGWLQLDAWVEAHRGDPKNPNPRRCRRD